MLCNNDDSSLPVLINRQPQINKDIGTHKNIPFLPTGLAIGVRGNLWTIGTWNCSLAWNVRPQWKKLQDKHDQDWTHYKKDK